MPLNWLAVSVVITCYFQVDGATSEVYTYADVVSNIERLAAALEEAGVEPGHVICMVTSNRVEYPVVYYAVALIGAVFQPLNPFYTAGDVYIKTDILSSICLVVGHRTYKFCL